MSTLPGTSPNTSSPPDQTGAETPTRIPVPIRAAAAQLGVSANTVRRWIREGKLQTERQPRPQGYVVLVHLSEQVPGDGEQVSSRVGDHHVPEQVPTEHLPLALDRAAAMAEYNRQLLEPVMAELAETRRQLTDQAEAIGRLEAELAQARGELAGLQALRSDPATAAAPGVPQSTRPPDEPAARPWWRRLLG